MIRKLAGITILYSLKYTIFTMKENIIGWLVEVREWDKKIKVAEKERQKKYPQREVMLIKSI